MPRKKELSYFEIMPNSLPFQDILYSDFFSFNKINEFLDFEELELSLLERDKIDESSCQSFGVLTLSEWIKCNEFDWVAEGAIQHSFAVYCILLTLLIKRIFRKFNTRGMHL